MIVFRLRFVSLFRRSSCLRSACRFCASVPVIRLPFPVVFPPDFTSYFPDVYKRQSYAYTLDLRTGTLVLTVTIRPWIEEDAEVDWKPSTPAGTADRNQFMAI